MGNIYDTPPPLEEALHPDWREPITRVPRLNRAAYIEQETEKQAFDRAAAFQMFCTMSAREDFGFFMEFCFCNESNGEPFEQQWFHDDWAAAMDYSNRLLIIAPRDHGKTTQIVGRVIWELGRNPNLRIKIVCASDGRAKERLFEIVQYIKYNKRVQEVFPNLVPAEDGEWSKHKIVVKRTAMHRDASVEALGITSTATGGRADLLIADDVVDRRNSLSFPALREQIKQAWKSDWTNLLEPDSRVWYICTLWHKDDLSHELIDNPAYKVMKYAVDDNFGALWPGKWSAQALFMRFLEIGSVEFNRGFRNIAVDLDTAAVNPAWFDYRDLAADERFVTRLEQMEIIASYDTAGTPTGKATQDWASACIIAVDKEDQMIYVLAARHYRKTVKGQALQVIRDARKYSPFRSIVEKASQAAVDEWVINEAPWMAGILEIQKPTQQSKHLRLMGVTPLLEAGRIIFDARLNPNNKQWNPANGNLEGELVDSPFGRHDDISDAFVQGVNAARVYFLDWGASGGENTIHMTIGADKNNGERRYKI
jgi:hypothetical protein